VLCDKRFRLGKTSSEGSEERVSIIESGRQQNLGSSSDAQYKEPRCLNGWSIKLSCAVGPVILLVQCFIQECFLKTIWRNYDLRNDENMWTSAVP
ncbi:hypothetical protein X801_01082, partial [Opisthorchis viverrini]